MFNIEFYVNEKGEVPVRDYLKELKSKAMTDKKAGFSMKRYIITLEFWKDSVQDAVKSIQSISKKIFGN